MATKFSACQVFFGMAKFLVFDTVAAMIYRQFPWLHNRSICAFGGRVTRDTMKAQSTIQETDLFNLHIYIYIYYIYNNFCQQLRIWKPPKLPLCRSFNVDRSPRSFAAQEKNIVVGVHVLRSISRQKSLWTFWSYSIYIERIDGHITR